MKLLRVINLSNARLQVGEEDFIEPKSIKDFPLDISVEAKHQLVSYASIGIAKVFEVDVREKVKAATIESTVVEEPNKEIKEVKLDTEARPKQVRKNRKK